MRIRLVRLMCVGFLLSKTLPDTEASVFDCGETISDPPAPIFIARVHQPQKIEGSLASRYQNIVVK